MDVNLQKQKTILNHNLSLCVKYLQNTKKLTLLNIKKNMYEDANSKFKNFTIMNAVIPNPE